MARGRTAGPVLDLPEGLSAGPPPLPPDMDDRPRRPDPEPRPPAGPVVSNARLGMLVFLAAEAMFFTGLIGAFLVFRFGSPVWPPPGQPRLPLLVTGVNTAILLASGYTMARGLRAIRRNDRRALARGLLVTALLGTTFLAVQGAEWMRLVRFGLTLSAGTYGSTFYTLIGTHGLHVLGAVCWLLIVLIGAARARFSAARHVAVELCGMYWYFVVGLWPVLFGLVYLT
ncbi:MAG: heme-copper oxidase subunit III [candidate division NC10 bacterium]|nr:heme-copper oxidase subunit III [candidate division NC10 bacterium]